MLSDAILKKNDLVFANNLTKNYALFCPTNLPKPAPVALIISLLVSIAFYSFCLFIGKLIFSENLTFAQIVGISTATVFVSLLPGIIGSISAAVVFFFLLWKLGRISLFPDALLMWIVGFGLGSIIIVFGLPILRSSFA